MEQAKAVPIAERLRQIQIGSYSVNHGSHFKHMAVAPVCQEAAAEIERLQNELATSKRFTVMDTCSDVRSSSPTSGGGFLERELAAARELAACRGDDAPYRVGKRTPV